jgi:predicted RNA-binding protein (virulence factor B family)
VGNVTAPRVVVVRPDRSINLSLDAPVVIRR